MKLLLLSCLLFISICTFGQFPGYNLVPNPNFHQKSQCPNTTNFTVLNWYQGTNLSSADYFNLCALPNFGIPNNFGGIQESATGEAYMGMITWLFLTDFREFIEAPLYHTLIPGACYEVSIFYNRSDGSGYSNNLGVLLSQGNQNDYVGMNPQLEITSIMTDSVNWLEEKITFNASGHESHITIGNFKTKAQTTADGGLFGNAYYYIDSVSVRYAGVHSTSVDIELGDDIHACEDDFPVILYSNDPGAHNYWSTDDFGPFIAVSEPGKYYLTIFDGCVYGIDSVEVFMHDQPELELDDQEFCEGESVTFELDPTLGTYEWNDGSTDPNYTITESGTYTVYLTHDCGIIEETIEVEVGKSIDIPEQDDYYLCTSELPLLVYFLELDDGINEFDWSTGSDESVVFITQQGNYSLEVSNDCFNDQISFSVYISPDLPEEIPFLDTLICPGDTAFIDTGIGETILLWEDGSSDSLYIVEEPGIYTLFALNFCAENSYTFEVEAYTQPAFDLGSNLSICPGDSILITSPIGEDILWNGSLVDSEIWIKDEGYVVAEYQGICSLAVDSIQVLLNGQSPQIELPDSLLLCAGDSILLSTGDLITGVDYLWNTGNIQHEIFISEPGIYQVLGSNSCGMDMDSVVIILGDSLPEIQLDSLYIICPADSLELTIHPGTAAVLWDTGNQDSTETFMEEGTYSVQIENDCKAETTTFVLQNEATLPAFDLGEDISLCQGENTTIQAPLLDGSYLWNTTETTTDIEVSTAGTYVLEVEGICNTVTDSLTIIDLGVGPTVNLGQDVQICEGDSIILQASGTDILDIEWNTGDTTEILVILQEGNYYINVFNECGASSDSINLNFITETPQIDLGEDQQICLGDSILLDVGNQAGTISWNTGDDGQNIFVSDEGWYEAVLSSSCGDSHDSIYISTLASPFAFNLGSDTVLCEGSSITVTFPGIEQFNVEWQDGSDNNTYTFDSNQLYWLSVSNECGLETDSISVVFHPPIYPFEFEPVDDLCYGDTVFLDGYQDNVVSYTWQDNSSASSYIVTESGTYSLIAEGNCQTYDSEIEINYIEQLELAPSIDAFYTYCEGQSLQLDLESSGIDGIVWEDGSTEFQRSFSESGLYNFSLYNFCQDSSYAFNLTFVDCISNEIYVPNIFTPNDDGTNDVFTIELPSDWLNPTMDTKIYNRWGEQMFSSDKVDFGWDGHFKGSKLNPGVYVYIIKIQAEIDEELREIILQGDITIMN